MEGGRGEREGWEGRRMEEKRESEQEGRTEGGEGTKGERESGSQRPHSKYYLDTDTI